ncbi:MAG: shikimate kinase [Anaerolineae bacterium]
MNDRNIVLTGFMATGKSSVGQIIAQELDRVFFDVDTAIEHRTCLTIPRIFANHSEPFFRAVEKGICHEISLQRHLVIATGGGALIDTETRQTFLHSAFVVNLSASPVEIEARLRASDARPLAGDWQGLFAQRRAIYAAMPHQVDTNARTPAEIAEEVISLWHNDSL